jgi:hypothetical protein
MQVIAKWAHEPHVVAAYPHSSWTPGFCGRRAKNIGATADVLYYNDG